jgi:prophage antirepressor-like protein
MQKNTTKDAATPQIFDFNSNLIRVFVDDQRNPWFVANDICRVLEYANPRDAIRKFCRAEGVAKRDILTEGGIQQITVINEGNLYRLILKSHKPQAEAFESWVCDEVLPTIRKTGRYEHVGSEPFGSKPAIPFDFVCPHMLDSLRRISRPLANAYLVARGVTPDYVSGLLGNPEAAAFSGRDNADRTPLEVLKIKVPEYASAQDENCWYLFQKDWEKVCQGYSAKWTARDLADLGLLRHDEGRLTMKAGLNLFGSRGGKRRRPYVYAVRKTLLDAGNLPVAL